MDVAGRMWRFAHTNPHADAIACLRSGLELIDGL
jgi:hypothetical protein